MGCLFVFPSLLKRLVDFDFFDFLPARIAVWTTVRRMLQGKVAEGRGAHGMISDVSATLRVSPASQWSRTAGGARGEQLQT